MGLPERTGSNDPPSSPDHLHRKSGLLAELLICSILIVFGGSDRLW